MKFYLLLSVLFLVNVELINSQKHVGCYWGSWTSINQINIKLCTHAYFAFYVTDSNGVLTTTSSTESEFLALKSQNANVKLLASIGGYNAGTAAFSAMATNPTALTNFVNNCVALAEKYDGIDLDWEYPAPSEQQSFINVLNKLKTALAAKGKILAIAVSSGTWQISQSYSISGVCANVDFVNLMSYDMQWPYTITGTNAGYSRVDAAVMIWLNAGCPSNKLVLGLASYGYNFNLASSSNHGVGDAASGASAIPYSQICGKVKGAGWTIVRSDQTPYAYNGNEWISYDDKESILAKLNIVTSRNLVGAFFWSTEQDDYSGSCGLGSFPLISAVASALNNGAIPAVVTSATTKAPAQTTKAPAQTTTRAAAQTTKAAGQTTATTKAATGTFKCTSDGFFANPNDCNKYYRCVSGTLYDMQCGVGLGWSTVAQTCDFKDKVPGCK